MNVIRALRFEFWHLWGALCVRFAYLAIAAREIAVRWLWNAPDRWLRRASHALERARANTGPE